MSGQPSVRIDRLTLTAGTMTEAQGRRLAELVGQELLQLPGSASAQTEQVDVSVAGPAGRTLEATAQAVVAAIEAVLRADGGRLMAFYLRGALVEFLPTGLIAIPNVIVFQYNPETMTHRWTQSDPEKAGPNQKTVNPLAVSGDPGESFSFTLFLDAADTIADGKAAAALAIASGVYTRLAALEMLLFPSAATTGGLLGTVTAKIGSLFGASRQQAQEVPANTLNTVLFVWGPGRIVPVRVTDLTVTERLYDNRTLSPTHAEVQITLRVLTADELTCDQDALAPLARAANAYSQGLRQTLAAANSVNAADSVVGMLPI